MSNDIIKNDKIFFQVKSVLDKQLKITVDYWQKISTIKHPSIKGKEKEIKKVLMDPDIVRVSKTDNTVFLYYKKLSKHFLTVVVKHQNGNGFIITSYLTNKIKEGEIIWTKNKK